MPTRQSSSGRHLGSAASGVLDADPVLAAAEDGNVAARAADDGLLALDARIAPASFVKEGALG